MRRRSLVGKTEQTEEYDSDPVQNSRQSLNPIEFLVSTRTDENPPSGNLPLRHNTMRR